MWKSLLPCAFLSFVACRLLCCLPGLKNMILERPGMLSISIISYPSQSMSITRKHFNSWCLLSSVSAKPKLPACACSFFLFQFQNMFFYVLEYACIIPVFHDDSLLKYISRYILHLVSAKNCVLWAG
jgi:hypothetical protein